MQENVGAQHVAPMDDPGPVLEALTRRLAGCPPDFLAAPRLEDQPGVEVAAVVSDLLADLGGAGLEAREAGPFSGGDRGRLQTVLIAAWLLHDPWFRAFRPSLAPQARKLLKTGLDELAALVPPLQWVGDPDRREELARHSLQALGLRPAGETPAQAQDRLRTLSSVERRRVILEAQAAERRAREVREAMARQAAEEAVASYDRG